MHKEDFITPNSSLGEGIRCITVSKDNLLNRNFVKEKKEILKELELVIGIPIITMNQVHGACVEEIYTNSKRTIEADALYSSSSDLALGVFTADCLPIAVSYEDGSRFGIIHAGWRGLSKGILDNFLYKFNDSHSDINAWLGPCITKSNYEVGEDVYLSFTEQKEYEDLLDAMGYEPCNLGDISRKTGLTTAELSSMLLLLELEGLVEASPGGLYSRLPKRST